MDLIVVGAGSVGGHIALNLDEYSTELNLIGFVDDDLRKQRTTVFGYPVLGPVNSLLEYKNVAVFIGIAFPRVKLKIVELLSVNTSLHFPTLVSNRAWISKGTTIGKGVIIYPGVSINYGCEISDHVVINMNCAIGHNCKVAGFSSLAPGVNFAGHSEVGVGVDVGIGCSTKQRVKIGDFAIIGGQTMLTGDVNGGAVVVGIPGREVSNQSAQVGNQKN